MRTWVRWSAAAMALGLVLCGVAVGAATRLWNRSAISTVDRVDFARPLAVPPLATSRVDGAGRRVFELGAVTGRTDFGRGQTRTAGFNGGYLGPTLRAARGEQVTINVHNGLDEATTVHWHGMHLPAAMDGGPHQLIKRGATWSPSWRIDQPAATLWYHPHPMGQTEEQVYAGLAGMFILDDPATDVPDLPHQYGADDVPVIVQDKRFTRDGQFTMDAPMMSEIGVLGDTLLVNGTVGPYHEVTSERVRLRLLNASTARVYRFGFSDDRPFALVGTDGGLLPAPHETDRVQLSPGERAEVVVSMRPGERVVLRSYPPDLGGNFLTHRFAGGADTFDVLQLRAAGTLAVSPPLPAKLVDVPRLDPRQAVQTRSFRLSGHHINGEGMDPDRIDATVTVNTSEIWTIRNTHDTPHSFHVHDVHFQVLSVDGREPPPALGGWKDTVLMLPETEVRIIARFADYADPHTPYMFHCHVLFHEDRGMMGQFVVVEPGQTPGHVHHP